MTNIGVILKTNIGHFGPKINNKYRGRKTCRTEFSICSPIFLVEWGQNVTIKYSLMTLYRPFFGRFLLLFFSARARRVVSKFVAKYFCKNLYRYLCQSN